MVCVPGMPLCRQCPLRRNCISLAQRKESLIPVSIAKKPLVLKHAAAALITDRKGRFLILQRPGHGLLAGLWKLPGGFQSDREGIRAGLEKTVREETGITIASAEEVAVVNHAFTHFRMKLHGFRCAVSGKISPSNAAKFKWITPPDMSKYAFGKADRELLRKMIGPAFPG
jgi:A/G-specific adenine glycosylase